MPAGQLRGGAGAPTTATCGWCGRRRCTSARLAIEDVGRRPRRRPAELRGRDGLVMDSDPRPRQRPGPGGRRPRDRDPPRRRRLGPAGPALRAGRHRPAGARASRRSPRRWAWTRSSERGSLTAGRAGPARPRTSRSRRCWSRSPGPPTSPAAPPSSSGWCCRRRPTRQIPDDPADARSSSPASTPTGRRCGSSPARPAHGATYCALRLRAHDDDQSVVGGTDLVPGLLALLGATLSDEQSRSRRSRERAVRRRGAAPTRSAPAPRAALARAGHHRRRC